MSKPFAPIEVANLDWHNDLPFSKRYEDVYSSSESGIRQSRYVFINGNHLLERWSELPNSTDTLFNIGETGFGSGLNFLVTLKLWEEFAPASARLHYFSCEKHPLRLSDLQRCLALWPELSQYAIQLYEQYPVLTQGYHHLSFCNGRIKLTLMLGDALECFEQLLVCGDAILESKLRQSFIDAWYLDGFSPAKNEDMWSYPLFSVLAMLSKENATYATYTAAQIVKSSLSQAGFTVEKKKGFGPKRHMLSGVYKKPQSHYYSVKQTPWHASIPFKSENKTAHIIGGGLAGCFMAHCLANRGWTVTLFDERHAVGAGASGNYQAVLFPKLSAYDSPLTQLMLSSFLYANKIYKGMLRQYPELGELNGSLLLAYDDKELQRQTSLETWLHHYPELGQLITADAASKLSGISINHPGLYIPLSGWINSPVLCELLIDRKGIILNTNTTVDSFSYNGKSWIINENAADVLIICSGNKTAAFNQTQYLPIKPIRGQMSTIAATSDSSLLKIPICGDGHVLPAMNGCHSFGASYNLGDSSEQIQEEDDLSNLCKLLNISSSDLWSKEILHHWAAVRASTPDYLPLVGPVVKRDEFIEQFSALELNSKRWIGNPGPYIPGLYVCAGFGSRGLTTIPLCAEWLASLINNEIGCIPRTLIKAISPTRFLRKNIIRGVR
ncbi:bifunctional tRNA (5-methylaminomethyl-2-thiouridine)(34)-methyltransferase MnmD/FAD-dependent 5-carboxymethylaminomethyl-2-thiouridine(34) oxidoreductase MnmC [Legionella worsleiensis]|uniref:tRNA 5-methylaminomethyl-2-thiouridine biosynthesis bifunctional protein MnmC n=1 Tax=Legionella worsleiensis TaxID=45076 RepID=A0A0W1AJ66_9GAMM|nr:bifunctional tRNA (5-methylaminomethyl-2-thiouridine)(34)-methyltransferase MnmD/FAD-dependent 5-carboxymethylaminomethyl-2-thiouridine(34) oxidoreductase MnmC [Legionella worsleiensis]KTD81381.1 tRNA 5-methylaminomethyl-2-thiouridine biosynthesis bifunctional protein MnmC [Legionella worsleiensis]STY30009.1 putative peptidase [Legionella worsleiensis]